MKKSRLTKKRSFTLLELLISLSLSAIIITLLLTFTFKLFLTERKIKIAKQELLGLAALEIKLRSLFSELILDGNHHKTTLQNKRQSVNFYTAKKESRLFFLFDAHIDPNPLFSGPLQGELFLDEHKNLKLITRSLIEKTAPKIETLASNIQALDFTFFKRKEAEYPGDKTYSAAAFWKEKEMPAIWQIIISKEGILEPQKNQPLLTLTFFLDNMKSSLVCFEDK